MLLANRLAKGLQRLPGAAVLRSPQLHWAGLSSVSKTPTKLPTTLLEDTTNAMLQNACKEHERKSTQSANTLSQSRASPPKPAAQPSITSFARHGQRDPLKPTSASTLNGLQTSRGMYSSGAGIKRTASGLAKQISGTFGDEVGSRHRPMEIDSAQAPPRGRDHTTVLFDEDDFDSDIDLEFEEPLPKKSLGYPKLPEYSSNNPSTALVGHSRLQTESSHTQPSSKRGISTVPGAGHGEAVFSPVEHSYESSAPVPWSSSPLEHYRPAMAPQSLQDFSYKAPTTITRPPVDREDVSVQPKVARRRRLPWPDEEVQEPSDVPTHAAALAQPRVKNSHTFTPLPKDSKKSQYPWNTTVSTVKEQQKKHREESRKVVKKVDGTDESVQKARSTQKRPARVFLSEEQQHVLSLVIDQKKSVFFTGSAGTGKSVLMREIIASLRKKFVREPDRIAVTASTGLAACNVGGVTLHSFAGIGLGKEDVPELVRKIKRNQKAKHRWLRTKVLVVDEVSMVDGEMFDKLESIARQIRGNARPFGGIQLVITGDFFQLPPVPDYNKVAKFAFDASTWKTSIEHTIGLHHVFRQSDPIFAGMLNEMREGRLSQSSIAAFKNLERDLTFQDSLDATELFPTRGEVDKANAGRLGKLQGDSVPFPARDGGSIVDKTQRDRLLSNCMAPELITLKKGSQVMLIKNIDEQLVNGSLGRVIGFLSEREFDSYDNLEGAFQQSPGGTLHSKNAGGMGADEVRARLADSFTTSNRWPLVRFAIADGTWRDLLCQPEAWKIELPSGEVQASRQQIPLILAWALSIHKAQGQTLERVKVNLGKVFEKGQAYVALSRATSMAGLQVLNFDPKKVMAHDKVRTFYSNLSRVELAEKNKERIDGMKAKTGTTAADDYESRFVSGDFDGDF